MVNAWYCTVQALLTRQRVSIWLFRESKSRNVRLRVKSAEFSRGERIAREVFVEGFLGEWNWEENLQFRTLQFLSENVVPMDGRCLPIIPTHRPHITTPLGRFCCIIRVLPRTPAGVSIRPNLDWRSLEGSKIQHETSISSETAHPFAKPSCHFLLLIKMKQMTRAFRRAAIYLGGVVAQTLPDLPPIVGLRLPAL